MSINYKSPKLPTLKAWHLPDNCRPELGALLSEVYGYDGFRDLEIYDDLFTSHQTSHISQGILIESIVREAEKAASQTEPDNILLTAPTGVGKSMLFQLTAIYLGQQYQHLTIVVSPLKALIEDQVESLRALGYTRAAYASSDLSPMEKAEVYRQVREGEIDLFYLSPELLLSYDIHHFVGDRHIGLIVVDEAHTVTTWGKEFRVDYWFLGRYLKGLKATLGYQFPLFALTATAVWNPSGWNDMVFETIRSLQMEPCVLYVGTVTRHNIGFDIRQLTLAEGQSYNEAKTKVVLERTKDFINGHKTLLYYPFASGIDQRVKAWVEPTSWSKVATYYGKKDQAQKAAIVEAFKDGSKKLIVATKAFGMGIDISDIDRVYHIAPSSTFVDYVQEIGRSARDEHSLGIAATDFHERDFYYMTHLHQIGNLAQEQLMLILRQLMQIYKMKGQQKEIQVSLSDFEFAVRIPKARTKLDYEAELGQVVKTALLWLEDDLQQRYDKKLLEVLPQNLLGEGYIQDKTSNAFAEQFADYLTPVEGEENIWKVQLEKLWENGFAAQSFSEFKAHITNGTLVEGARPVLVGKHIVELKEDSNDIKARLDRLFADLKLLFNIRLRTSKGHVEESELREVFAKHQMYVRSAKQFITSLLESRTEEGRSVSYISSQKKRESNELLFTVTRGYDLLLSRYQKLFSQRIIGEKGTLLQFYCTPFSDLNMLLNLLSMLGGLSFIAEGGGSPAVLVRFHEPETLKSLAENEDYLNQILEVNEQLFNDQITLFRLFFGNSKLSDRERWAFIESYFTGSSIEELKERYG